MTTVTFLTRFLNIPNESNKPRCLKCVIFLFFTIEVAAFVRNMEIGPLLCTFAVNTQSIDLLKMFKFQIKHYTV